MPKNLPINEVSDMKRQGLSNNQIIQNLQSRGYNSEQIFDALNQIDAKKGVEGSNDYIPSSTDISIEEAPSPEEPTPYTEITEYPLMQEQPYPEEFAPMSARPIEEEIEVIAEQIVQEQWKRFMDKIGNLPEWKREVQTQITGIKRDIENLNQQIANLQQAIIGKINEYNENLTNINTQIQTMDKVFEKVVPTLTKNIKDLSSITENLKSKRKH